MFSGTVLKKCVGFKLSTAYSDYIASIVVTMDLCNYVKIILPTYLFFKL